jgi:hypothetical protein
LIDGSGRSAFEDSIIGELSSRVIQNGQFVGGNKHADQYDNTTSPGSRADGVQSLLGHWKAD